MENYELIILFVFLPLAIFFSIMLILAIISEYKIYNKMIIDKYFKYENPFFSFEDKKWLVKTALEIQTISFNDVCIFLTILEQYKDRMHFSYDIYSFNPYCIELSLDKLSKKRIMINMLWCNEISIEILLKLYNYLLSENVNRKFLQLYKIYNEIIKFPYFNELFCLYAKQKINSSGKNKILL